MQRSRPLYITCTKPLTETHPPLPWLKKFKCLILWLLFKILRFTTGGSGGPALLNACLNAFFDCWLQAVCDTEWLYFCLLVICNDRSRSVSTTAWFILVWSLGEGLQLRGDGLWVEPMGLMNVNQDISSLLQSCSCDGFFWLKKGKKNPTALRYGLQSASCCHGNWPLSSLSSLKKNKKIEMRGEIEAAERTGGKAWK